MSPNNCKTLVYKIFDIIDVPPSDYPKGMIKFLPNILEDEFDLVEMDPKENNVKFCSSRESQFCCIASYEYSVTHKDGRFSLGVFKGIHMTIHFPAFQLLGSQSLRFLATSILIRQCSLNQYLQKINRFQNWRQCCQMEE